MSINTIISDAISRFKKRAPGHFECLDESHCEWYAWPQVWSDTTCGRGGYGGQSLTVAQTVVVGIDGWWLVYINGSFRYLLEHPSSEFFESMSAWKLPGGSVELIQTFRLRGGRP